MRALLDTFVAILYAARCQAGPHTTSLFQTCDSLSDIAASLYTWSALGTSTMRGVIQQTCVFMLATVKLQVMSVLPLHSD
jgi:hypothetical protein